jgi:hypothetical protein
MSDARTFPPWPAVDDVGAAMPLAFTIGMAGRNQASELKATLVCQCIRLGLRDWQRVNERSQRLLTRFLARVDASQECFGMRDFTNAYALLTPNLSY